MPHYDLKIWDPTQTSPDATINIIGARGCGKSTLLKDVCHKRRRMFCGGRAYVGTADCVKDLEAFLPAPVIEISTDLTEVQTLIDNQNEIAATFAEGSEHPDMLRLLLLLDDLMFDEKVMKSKVMKNLYYNGRHAKLGVINCVQYAYQLPKWSRGNTDVVIVLMTSVDPENARTLHDLWFKPFIPSLTEFMSFLGAATKDKRALVYDKAKNDMFMYKTDVHTVPKRFMFGTRKFHLYVWRYSRPRPSAVAQRQLIMDRVKHMRRKEEFLEEKDSSSEDGGSSAKTGKRKGIRDDMTAMKITVSDDFGHVVMNDMGRGVLRTDAQLDKIRELLESE